MTGPKMAEKSDSYHVTSPERDQPSRGKRRRSALIAAVASLSTALVLGSIFCGVIFYLQHKRSDEKSEWISWIRNIRSVDIHESVLIDEKEQTILMVSSEAYRINEENSMALYDFKLNKSAIFVTYIYVHNIHGRNVDFKGYVAIRDFHRNLCLVSDIPNPDFQSMKATLEARRGRKLNLLPRQEAMLRPGNMTSSELGPKLSKFCNDVPALWFDITSKSGIEKRKADTVIIVIVTADKREINELEEIIKIKKQSLQESQARFRVDGNGSRLENVPICTPCFLLELRRRKSDFKTTNQKAPSLSSLAEENQFPWSRDVGQGNLFATKTSESYVNRAKYSFSGCTKRSPILESGGPVVKGGSIHNSALIETHIAHMCIF